MRSRPLIAAAVVAALAVAGFGVASHFRKRAKGPEKKARAPLAEKRLSPVERRYLELLAKQLGIPKAEHWNTEEMIPLLVRLNQERNGLLTPRTDPARTPWLLPPPRRLPSRELTGASAKPFDLASGRLPALPPNAREYQYAITNVSAAPARMPILHAGPRWDRFDALLETSGLRGITDEVDRAIGVWRFVAERRVHGQPVTEGDEEHDLIKYLACYGYGFCDDSAQAVAVLADGCGLKARIRGLGGHVVPEIFAGGQWRMFDPDFAVYFHADGDPRAVFGVDELARDRKAFTHVRALGAGGPYDKDYADLFSTTEDNIDWPLRGTRDHRIEHRMAPGERVVFSNFNWGRYFLGAFPDRPPRFYNGYFEVPLSRESFTPENDVIVTTQGQEFAARNSSDEPRAITCTFDSPFPIVGGEISELPKGVSLHWADRNGQRAVPIINGVAALDAFVAQLAPQPTRTLVIKLSVPPQRAITFGPNLKLTVDFQFAEAVLLKLGTSAATFSVVAEDGGQFRGELISLP